MKDNFSQVRFISYEKIKEPTTKSIREEEAMEWGKGKEDGKDFWNIKSESILSSVIPLSSSDFSLSDNVRITEKNRVISHDGDSGNETCIINEELEKVYYYYY